VVPYKSLISGIVRFGTWIAHSFSTKVEGRTTTQVHSRVELPPAFTPAKSDLNWPALLRAQSKHQGGTFSNARTGFARSGNRMEQQMGLFHCMAE
jgi:hypothetical protein